MISSSNSTDSTNNFKHRSPDMGQKRTIAVSVQGQEYRIRSDAEEGSVKRAAALVDETISTVLSRSGTVDSLHVAVLGALNLANQLISLRDQFGADQEVEAVSACELRDLVDFVESIVSIERSVDA
jgi:cell division protein ZapA (FtsZ GTPase activity inhibitor)